MCNLYVSEHYVLADGVSRTRITAMVFDVLDLPAPGGTGVRFTVTPGSVSASFYPGYKQTTAGIAEVELIAPTEVGVCTVFAYVDTGGGYATSIISNRQVIYFEGGEPRS
jgi:hypothetical protein